MSRYINYLTATLLKRPFVYVVIVLYSLYTIGTSFIFGRSGIGFSASLNSFTAWFSFIFCVVFITLVIIHSFQKQELEGVELLVAAKPISRKSIIFGKIIVVLASLVLFCILVLIVGYIGANFDKSASQSQMFKYGISSAVGTFITGLLTASIALLFGTFMSKVGMLISSLMFSIGIFIGNMSIVPSLGAYVPRTDYLNMTGVQEISENPDGTISFTKLYANNSSIKSNVDSSYSYMRFIDIWGQWSNVYKLIQPKSGASAGSLPETAKLLTEQVTNSNLILIPTTNDDKKYIYWSDIEFDNDTNVITTPDWYSKEIKEALVKMEGTSPSFVGGSLEGDIDKIFNYLKSDGSGGLKNLIKKQGDKNTNTEKIIKTIIVKNMRNEISSLSKKKYGTDKNHYIKEYEPDSLVIITGTKPFINPYIVGPIWGIIAIVLIGLTIRIYLKRDFK